MNRRLLPPLLLASVIAIVAFAASAQTLTTSVGVDATAQAQPASDTSGDARFDSTAKPQIDRNCLRQTGSRIVARGNNPRYGSTRAARDSTDRNPKRCVAANGRVYSREDIERTGEIDLAAALRKLDPAIY